MSYNGSGTFLINTAGQPVVSGTVISSTAFNALTADLATGLSTAITKDGQTTVTANIPMGTYKFTGLGAGSAATDSANLSQVQSTVTKLLASVSGADTITAVASPTLGAYAAGQMFYFVAAGTNTGAVTLNIDSLGAKAVTRDGSTALTAGDLRSGEVIVVVYDGTRFQVVSQVNSGGDATFANVSITSALNVGGVATFTGNPVLSGGTANGVLYLNASKVATSGSALVFDGTRLGLNVTPSANQGRIQANGAGQSWFKFYDSTAGWNFGTFYKADGSTALAYLGGGGGSAIAGGTVDDFVVRSEGNLLFAVSTTERMRLDSSGNLGLGVTPSAWSSYYRPLQAGTNGAFAGGNDDSVFTSNAYYDGNWKYITSSVAATRLRQTGGTFTFSTAPSGTAGNTITFTQAMTLDASGNLSLGTTTSGGLLTLKNANPAVSLISVQSYANTNEIGDISFDQATDLFTFSHKLAGGGITFQTNSAERARITSGGYFKASDSGSYIDPGVFHEFTQTANSEALQVRATNGSYANTAFQVRASRDTTNNSYYYISCYNDGAANYRLRVADSGNVTNTNGSYGTISDAKMKTDIVDAGSQWADLKAVRFRKFKMKDDPSGLMQLGVVAQELEQTSPGLVEEHPDRDGEGNDLGTTTKSVKTSVLLMKAAVALQEAMARIEQLEAKVAALETK